MAMSASSASLSIVSSSSGSCVSVATTMIDCSEFGSSTVADSSCTVETINTVDDGEQDLAHNRSIRCQSTEEEERYGLDFAGPAW